MPPPSELGRVYDEHAQALFAFLIDFTGREADARDLLQEVFIRLARRDDLLAGVANPRAFLIRLAHNLAIDGTRRQITRERHHDQFGADIRDAIASPADPDRSTFETALHDAMQSLPPEQRAVVHLKTWGGLTFDEIAEALEIPANTAASRYRYGLDKLREQLRPIYNEIQ